MKSGLKGHLHQPRSENVRSNIPYRDEKRTERLAETSSRCWKQKVTFHTAMKSGLKVKVVSECPSEYRVTFHTAMKSGLKETIKTAYSFHNKALQPKTF